MELIGLLTVADLIQVIFHTVRIFLFLAIADVLVGGPKTIILREDDCVDKRDWSDRDQMLTTLYQIGYGVTIYFALESAWLHNWRAFAANFILLSGYVEDTAFYLLMPVFQWWNKFWTGKEFTLPNGKLFPDMFGGWMATLGRILDKITDGRIGRDWRQPRNRVLYIYNPIAITIAILIIFI